MNRYQAGKTWVIKIGSSILTDQGQGLSKAAVSAWVDDIVRIKKDGINVVLVSSGAVAEGMSRLGITTRPDSLHLLQAAAAVGQMGLIQLYESHFQKHGLHTAQVLLTHEDLKNRERYINARSTLLNLLSMNVVPVINENDTVVTDEIRFGDNDILAALVANLIEANTLCLLTDQLGLYDKDPREFPDAKLVTEAWASDPGLEALAGKAGTLGSGGMISKIKAARIAARSGASTVITSGHAKQVIARLASGDIEGSLLKADVEVVTSRKRWLATLPPKGRIELDDGAVKVLQNHGKSLLPVGVKKVSGEFSRGDAVSCIDDTGKEIARGLINYNRQESAAIIGIGSKEIESVLGYIGDEELIHRDNLVLI